MEILKALLDSWDRNNVILVNLLRAIPEGGMEAKALQNTKAVAEIFAHLHYVRLVLVAEDAPEFAREVPEGEWRGELDRERVAEMLIESAKVVRDAVEGRVKAGLGMDVHYNHPILMLQHLVWHEGYHHGQIKLALKAAEMALADEIAGPFTWDVWMDKRDKQSTGAGGL